MVAFPSFMFLFLFSNSLGFGAKDMPGFEEADCTFLVLVNYQEWALYPKAAQFI